MRITTEYVSRVQTCEGKWPDGLSATLRERKQTRTGAKSIPVGERCIAKQSPRRRLFCSLQIQYRKELGMSRVVWSDSGLLKSSRNPYRGRSYEITIRNPEVTFLGARNQPDFACVTIAYVPSDALIELKSLKIYFYDFRNRLLSYERFANVVFDDVRVCLNPQWIKLSAAFNPRGGITSELIVDSRVMEKS